MPYIVPIDAFPATLKLFNESVVPIPTFPLLSMRNCSVPPVDIAITDVLGENIPVLLFPTPKVYAGDAAVPLSVV